MDLDELADLPSSLDDDSEARRSFQVSVDDAEGRRRSSKKGEKDGEDGGDGGDDDSY